MGGGGGGGGRKKGKGGKRGKGRRGGREGGGGGGGGKESENRKHGKERKQCTLVPGSFLFFHIYHYLSLPFLSLSLLPSLFPSVSLEACQLEPWLPPRELEDRECVWSSGGRVKDREKMR